MKVKKDFVTFLRLRRWFCLLVMMAAFILSSCTETHPASEPEPTDTSRPIVAATLTNTPQRPTTKKVPPLPPEAEIRDLPQLVLAIDPASLVLPAIEAGRTPINIGLFFAVRAGAGDRVWSETEVAESIGNLITGTIIILAQCEMYLELEAAQIVALPDRLLRLQGNEEDSWGGHPPPGTENVELFNYQQDERLTDDTRELFAYGKKHTSPNTIAVFTVEHITYYAEQQLTGAGGLSFPPNVYHHPDDYPLRNSVLLVTQFPEGDLPAIGRISAYGLAHEVGHMLLNSGDHEADAQNLMASRGGITLTSEQCDRMRHNQDRLYGDEAVPDPGPPGVR